MLQSIVISTSTWNTVPISLPGTIAAGVSQSFKLFMPTIISCIAHVISLPACPLGSSYTPTYFSSLNAVPSKNLPVFAWKALTPPIPEPCGCPFRNDKQTYDVAELSMHQGSANPWQGRREPGLSPI